MSNDLIPPQAVRRLAFLDGGGECGERLRACDWRASRMGPPEQWPLSLQMVLRTILASKFPMAIHWGRDLLTFYNDAFAHVLGSKHPGHLGRPVFELWREMWDQLGPIFEHVFTGETYYVENASYAPERGHTQRETYFTHCHSPIWGDSGQVEGVLLVLTESTREVLAERAFVALNRRQAFQLDMADRLRAQGSAEEITAVSTELLGKYLRVSRVYYTEIHPASHMAFLQGMWTSPEYGALPPLPASVRLDDLSPEIMAILEAGKPFVVDDINTDRRTAANAAAYQALGIAAIVVVPLMQQGRVTCALHLTMASPRLWTRDDISMTQDVVQRTWEAAERVRAVAALHAEHDASKRAQAALRDADSRKDEFLAMLAHELRNPLAPIGTAAELLRRFQFDEATVKRTSEVISRQVRHMTGLIDDLLDVSRVTRGMVALKKETLDFRHVVSHAVEQVRPLMEARHHRFNVHLPPEPVYVYGDNKRLVQVLANLLNNAAKYTPEDGFVELRVGVRGENLTVTVRDNGVGMRPELLARAFELFAQDERTLDRSQGGMGLGLALVQRLAEAHQGSVAAHSDGIGKGSTFILRLPMAQPDPGSDVRPKHAGAEPPARSLNLLVVDDNVDAASTLGMVLADAGHTVRVENHPYAGMDAARAMHPDVCLLDIGLPDIDGNELARRLRARPETVNAVLVAITGYGQERDRQEAYSAGFDYHFVKPVDMERLFAVLARVTPQPRP
ncbi:response regulator [Duganella sp. FT92W]|uniref:histidine kinase n=1 Tax=Pseudoduganella rivuli TaxID=2666085 RepID=A0A7X2IT03_9BURK|nr:ATP-binding protein [Pseudoduganella rivuli]MRV75551.1 response regulator [Pseudoduganella rivuli]